MPDTVTSIGDYAFYGCSGITSFDLPDNIESLGTNSLRGLSLSTIVLPESITSVGKYFIDITNMTAVYIYFEGTAFTQIFGETSNFNFSFGDYFCLNVIFDSKGEDIWQRNLLIPKQGEDSAKYFEGIKDDVLCSGGFCESAGDFWCLYLSCDPGV